MYFRSEAINVRKTAENDASDSFNLESPNLAHTYHTGYDVTDYFWLAVIEVQKAVEDAAYDGFAAVFLVNCLG